MDPRPKVNKKGSMLSNEAISPRNTDIDVETIKARTKKQTGGEIAINAKFETEGMLKNCHVIRARNVSVQPTRARIAELRSLEHNEEIKSVFGNNQLGNTMGSSRFEYSSIISRNHVVPIIGGSIALKINLNKDKERESPIMGQ